MMDVDTEELNRVYNKWLSLTNMTNDEMELWDEHPCADHGLNDSEDWRDNTQMLMGQPKSSWGRESVTIAHQAIDKMVELKEQLPDEPAKMGPGTCPAREVITLLNLGHNPLDSFPSGNPKFAVGETAISATADPAEIEARLLEQDFESDEESLDEVYDEWQNHVNMTASEMEQWDDHPCADTASVDPQKVRDRNLNLLQTNKSEWGQDEIEDAQRTISFISRMKAQKPDDPTSGGEGTCPSEWAVSLMNWAYKPEMIDGMPNGKPNPEDNSVSTCEITF